MKNAFLLTTHNKGTPTWQGTAYRGKIDVLQEVWECAE
jgi:hypothetical protein